MAWPTESDVRLLAQTEAGPCVSLYVPLQSAYQDHMSNAKRYGQAVVRVSDHLEATGMRRRSVDQWAARLTEIERDLRQRDKSPLGIGVFLQVDRLNFFKLPTPPAERIVVADCFALRELVQQVERIFPRGEPAGPHSEAVAPHLVIELDRVLVAAHWGKVKRLWVREGAAIAGRLDRETGRVISARGGDHDVLDALAARVLGSGGEVRILTSEAMPGAVNAAAELY
jgi:hypothetical protein